MKLMNVKLRARVTQASSEVTGAVEKVLRTLRGEESSPDLESLLQYLAEYAWSGITSADTNWIPTLLHDICVPVELLTGRPVTATGDELVSKDTIEFVKSVQNAANARNAIDEGNPITIEWLAALANVSERTIRTATSPSNPNAIPITKEGHWTYIQAPHALEWLSSRKDFVPTQRPDNRPTMSGLLRVTQPGQAWRDWRESRELSPNDLARELGWTSQQREIYEGIESGTATENMLTLSPEFWRHLAAHLESEDPDAVAALTYRQLAAAYADWRLAS